MPDVLTVDDLRLVEAVCRTGAVGAAARELGIAQPSASQRLARVERRCGVRLFDRDTTGARPTPAGLELAHQARHVVAHLAGAVTAARAAAAGSTLRFGTILSLAPSVVPAVETLLDDAVTVTIDHGPELIDAVGEGALDATVGAVAEQITLPRSVRVIPLGQDELVILRRRETPPVGSGRAPLAGRRVVYSTYDLHGPQLRAKLEQLGAVAHLGPSLPTSIALARARGVLAVVPRSALVAERREGDVIEDLPFATRVRLTLVTGRGATPAAPLIRRRRELTRLLHLSGSADPAAAPAPPDRA